jgi:hypothetical protein
MQKVYRFSGKRYGSQKTLYRKIPLRGWVKEMINADAIRTGQISALMYSLNILLKVFLLKGVSS